MATAFLPPAAAPANIRHANFNLALARCEAARTAHDALPYPSTIAAEIESGEALAGAERVLAAALSPNLPAFARKLSLVLAGASVAPELVAALAADACQLDTTGGLA